MLSHWCHGDMHIVVKQPLLSMSMLMCLLRMLLRSQSQEYRMSRPCRLSHSCGAVWPLAQLILLFLSRWISRWKWWTSLHLVCCILAAVERLTAVNHHCWSNFSHIVTDMLTLVIVLSLFIQLTETAARGDFLSLDATNWTNSLTYLLTYLCSCWWFLTVTL